MTQREISSAAFQMLLCPVCAESFELSTDGTLGVLCSSGHRYDFARYGYLNMLTGTRSKATPDTSAMANARSNFLDAGHFTALTQQISASFADYAPALRADSVIVDAGCGPGHYLASLLSGPARDRAPIGLDLSVEALRTAVKANPQMLALVWDLWRPLPLAARSADVVLVVFAPRNFAEFQRILRTDGVLIVATPLPDHLAGLPQIIGKIGQQPDKHEALLSATAEYFDLVTEHEIHAQANLSQSELHQLLLMGPNGHHLTEEALASLTEDSYQVQFGFRVSVFKPIRSSPTTPAVAFHR